jgi:hypothetical protein
MADKVEMRPTLGQARPVWLRYLLMALALEKIVQHSFVTAAFHFNWGDIRNTVTVNPDLLMVLGAGVGVLFILSLWAMFTLKHWATGLLIGLALFDMIGEFVAQGTLFITCTVSFLVATMILVLTLYYRRGAPT